MGGRRRRIRGESKGDIFSRALRGSKKVVLLAKRAREEVMGVKRKEKR